MLGGGIPAGTVDRGIGLGADLIAIDGGSTDSGPHYLGTSTAKTARGAVARDLQAVLPSAAAAGIPVVIGSCGTSGTDTGVEWVHDIAAEVATSVGLHLRVARIYSQQDATHLERQRLAGRIHPLGQAGHDHLVPQSRPVTTSPCGLGRRRAHRADCRGAGSRRPRAVETDEVVRHADLIVLAVPTHRFRDLSRDLFAGKILVDAMNYWEPTDGIDEELVNASAGTSAVVQDRFPSARVVKSLNQLGYTTSKRASAR